MSKTESMSEPSLQTVCDWLRQRAQGEQALYDFQLRYKAGQSIETALCAVTTLTRKEARKLMKENFGFSVSE